MLSLSNVSLQFGGEWLFRDVSYRVNAGDRVALVGSNGSGKTSLLRLITGELSPESGTIAKQRGVSIGYLPQELIGAARERSLLEEAQSALEDVKRLEARERSITDALNAEGLEDDERDRLIEALGETHERLEALDAHASGARVEKILTGLGFRESDFPRPLGEFSGGWRMRVALAKLLVARHDLLLLDEPTNHLDLDSLRWVVDFLRNFRGALLLVSHDKWFVNSLTNRTLELYNKNVHAYNGKFEDYLEKKAVVEAQREKEYAQQQKKIKETERFIERFRYKNTKAKQVQSRVKALEKMERIELEDRESDVRIEFPAPPRSGKRQIELRGLRKAFGGLVLFDGLDFAIERGDRMAFVGRNGAGKTTLAKIVAGVESFQAGERIVGSNVEIAYYAQNVADQLDREKDMLDVVAEANPELPPSRLRAVLGAFLFTGDDAFKKVGVLSGGEKSRLALARMMLTKANLLVLDEPTNHLDLASKNVLQKALAAYEGSIVLVSHDVDFMKPLADTVYEATGSDLKAYPGDVAYYLERKEAETEAAAGGASAKPKSVSNVSRKEQKRLEAEERRRRYEKTKDVVKEAKATERAIEATEARVAALEAELAEERVFSDPALSKEKNRAYREARAEVENLYERWTALQERLDAGS
ncbi:MAG: ATP-binding cassette domain-containing protein [Ignavibacteriales bacterium]|nr:ATP-binding cassette domain-containing protein [Ignavibacteriales bacterium]